MDVDMECAMLEYMATKVQLKTQCKGLLRYVAF